MFAVKSSCIDRLFTTAPFLARDSMSAYAERAICLSVRLSVTRLDQSKTVEVRIMQLSLESSPIPLVFAIRV